MGFFSRKKKNEDEVDEVKKKTGVSKVGLVFSCGAALFSDGYANQSIGPVNTILTSYLYKGQVKANYSQLLTSMAFAGTVVGMVGFGIMSDKLGRKSGMLIATGIIVVFTILCCGAYGAHLDGFFNALIAYRFFLGIGIGAEYPSGSVAAAENTEDEGIKKNRQQMYFQLATNSMIDFGFVVATFVPLVLLWICGMNHLRVVWRLTLGLGVIPPLILLYFRIKMKNPDIWLKNSGRKISIPWKLVLKRYWVKLAAICLCWFIYDWITYPFGLYSSTITAVADKNSSLYTTLGWSCLVNVFYLPGTLVGAIFVVDRLGPKYTMILGLCLQSAFGFLLSGAYNPLTQNNTIAAFAVIYGLFLSFGELGPGNCLGLLATKAISPTMTRGVFYGVAAAVGKIGAFIGSYCFTQIIDDLGGDTTYAGNTGPFYIASALALVSASIVYFFIPNISADYMSDEDFAFRAYLEEHGFDTSVLGEADETILDPEKMAGGHRITPVGEK